MRSARRASPPCSPLTAGGITILVAAVVLFAMAVPAATQSPAPPGASACSGCHGAGSAGRIVPSLRGQAPEDIAAAMQAFRTGQLPATVMDRIAKGFTDEETRAIASWVSGQR
jgi:sulfide dehydrogenase cytochrome subunit